MCAIQRFDTRRSGPLHSMTPLIYSMFVAAVGQTPILQGACAVSALTNAFQDILQHIEPLQRLVVHGICQ